MGAQAVRLTLRLIADAAREIGAEPIFVTQARLATSSSSDADRRKIGVNYSYAHLSHAGLVRAFEATDDAIIAAAAAKNVRVLDLAARLYHPRGAKEPVGRSWRGSVWLRGV